MWKELNETIRAILQANTLIQEVFDWEVDKFNGGPAVTLTPSASESDYHTTTENSRIYAFLVRVFVDRTTRKDQDTERIMREMVDSITDDFDKNYTLTGITNPPGYIMLMVEALPGSWGYVEREGVYRVAEIIIRCKVDVDVTQIS